MKKICDCTSVQLKKYLDEKELFVDSYRRIDMLRKLKNNNINEINVKIEYKENQKTNSTQTTNDEEEINIDFIKLNERIEDGSNYTMRMNNPNKGIRNVGNDERVKEMVVLDTLRTNKMEFYNKEINYNTMMIDVTEDAKIKMDMGLAGIYMINNVEETNRVKIELEMKGENDGYIIIMNDNIEIEYKGRKYENVMSQMLRVIYSRIEKEYYIEREERLITESYINDIGGEQRKGLDTIEYEEIVNVNIDEVKNYRIKVKKDVEIKVFSNKIMKENEGNIIIENEGEEMVSIKYGTKMYSAMKGEIYVGKYCGNELLFFNKVPYRSTNILNNLINLKCEDNTIKFEVKGEEYDKMIVNIVDNGKDIAYKVKTGNERMIEIRGNEFLLYLNDSIRRGKEYEVSAEIFHKKKDAIYERRIAQKYSFVEKVMFI